MGPIETAIAASLVLAIFAAYKAMTHRLALQARDALVPVIREIMTNPESPMALKQCALGAFNASASPGFIPWLLRQPKMTEEEKKVLEGEHLKVMDGLMREHFFKINMLAAPHWYALVAFLFFALVILAMPFYLFSYFRVRIFPFLSGFEKKLIHPQFPTNNISSR